MKAEQIEPLHAFQVPLVLTAYRCIVKGEESLLTRDTTEAQIQPSMIGSTPHHHAQQPKPMMQRRTFLQILTALGLPLAGSKAADAATSNSASWNLSESQWRERLTPEAFAVLRKEGTERPFSSPLSKEKRAGVYHCAGCDLPLFNASKKYDSGTGWPSFFQSLPDAIETKLDFRLVIPRTEYHCKRCGGHQGHRFNDGPRPTGYRYCNNGVALTFKPNKTRS